MRMLTPRALIIGVLPVMLLAALSASLAIRAGHADAAIAATAEAVQPVAAGESAPRFVVETVRGERYDFDPSKLERPVILITFRGGWCPYCNMHLAELRHVLPEIRELGLDVLFLSGDRPEVLYAGLEGETAESTASLDYEILSDADAFAAIALGIAFRVDPKYVDRLVANDKDIADSSIRRRGVLPVPAVFAIGDDGVVEYSYANPDYKIRLPAAELLAVARSLVRG